jgi:hypothetical protein
VSAAVAGSSIEIAEGDENWLFLRRYENLELLALMADLSMWAKSHLPSLVAQFESRHARLSKRGIPYIVAIAPEKATIYPEKLPPGHRLADPTAGEMLTSGCVQAGIDAIDLAMQLRSAKGVLDLYYPTDSHWTYYGAYIAYRAIIDAVKKVLDVTEVGPHEVVFKDKDGFGDLGVHLVPERRGLLQTADCKTRLISSDIEAFDRREHAFAVHTCAEGRGKALVLRDSFATFLGPFLSRTFAETVYAAPPVAMMDDMVDDLKPDIVIHECSERALFYRPDGLADWEARSWRQIYLESYDHPNEADLIRPLHQALAEYRFDDAVALARKLAERSSPALDHNLAEALLKSGAYNEALETCCSAEVRQGADPFVRYLKAYARHALGDLDGAVESLHGALALRPGHARYLFQLGCYLAAGENKVAAAVALRAATDAAPAFVEAWDALSRVYALTGDTVAASIAECQAARLRGLALGTINFGRGACPEPAVRL